MQAGSPAILGNYRDILRDSRFVLAVVKVC